MYVSIKKFLLALFVVTRFVSASAYAVDWIWSADGPFGPGRFVYDTFSGSWFDGDSWNNLLVPNESETAVFDTDNLTERGGTPQTVYFGDYVRRTSLGSDDPSPADNALVRGVEVAKGNWVFNFNSSGNNQELPENNSGNLTIDDNGSFLAALRVGTQPNPGLGVRTTRLTVSGNGTLQTDGASIGRNSTTGANLTVVGPTTRLLSTTGDSTHRSDVEIGAGGVGTLAVLDGAKVEVQDGNAFLGRESGSHGNGIIYGSGSSLTIEDNLYVGFLGGSGTLSVSEGASLSADFLGIGSATSSGSVTVDEDSTLSVGELQISPHGTLYANSGVQGHIRSDGRVSIRRAAQAFAFGAQKSDDLSSVSPAVDDTDLPLQMQLTGSYVQTEAGILDLEIGGTSPGIDYSQLFVDGIAQVDGTVNITFVDDFVPSATDSFDLIRTTFLFDTSRVDVNILNLPSDLATQARLDYGILRFVPEPSTLALGLLAVIGSLTCRSGKRRSSVNS